MFINIDLLIYITRAGFVIELCDCVVCVCVGACVRVCMHACANETCHKCLHTNGVLCMCPHVSSYCYICVLILVADLRDRAHIHTHIVVCDT